MNRYRSLRLLALAGSLVLCASGVFSSAQAQTPAPSLLLRASVGRNARGREVTLELRNTGSAPVQLRNELTFEINEGGTWQTERGVGGLLQLGSCTSPQQQSSCLTVPAGGTLSVEPWDTLSCRLCACTRNVPVRGGTFRYVVRTCNEGTPMVSAPFVLPPRW